MHIIHKNRAQKCYLKIPRPLSNKSKDRKTDGKGDLEMEKRRGEEESRSVLPVKKSCLFLRRVYQK